MPIPSIPNGAAYMAATLYTGTSATQSISNTAAGQSFQPGFVWAKQRGAATDNVLYDVIRTGTNSLSSNSTAAEVNQTSTGCTVGFNSNGFTAGADNTGYLNYTGRTYVGWQWKAGGTAVSNTAGTITSQVSANTTSGFSVVTYTGTGTTATVGHGLGVAPKMIIVKVRSTTNDWAVYHSGLTTPATQALFLNLTLAAQSGVAAWNSTNPTSSVFSLGVSTTVNISGSTYVAYCWSEVAGYSKFGSYTGNGSADGPFVYTGFRPRWIMIKSSTTAQDWKLIDTSRNPYNSSNSLLAANTSSAEDTNAAYDFDILSNGFKPRNTFGYANTSGATYIYACFAENPFKYALAR